MDEENSESASMREFSDQLAAYLDGQGEQIEMLRSRSQPNPPWPETDSPMLGYLIARARELHVSDGTDAAIVWLAVHAWFEGALDERAKMLRSLGS